MSITVVVAVIHSPLQQAVMMYCVAGNERNSRDGEGDLLWAV